MPNALHFLQQAWPIYKKNFWRFIGLMVLFLVILLIIIGLLELLTLISVIWVKLALVTVFCLLAFGFSLASFQTLIINAADGKDTAFKKIFSSGFQAMFAVVAVVLLTGLAEIAGLLALIIPGIILSVWFTFVLIDSVKNPIGAIEIIRKSVATARKAPWHVANLLFVSTLIMSLLSYIPVVGGLIVFLIFYPVWMIAEYLQYKKVSALTKKEKASRGLIWSTIGIFVLIALGAGVDTIKYDKLNDNQTQIEQKLEQQIDRFFGQTIREN